MPLFDSSGNATCHGSTWDFGFLFGFRPLSLTLQLLGPSLAHCHLNNRLKQLPKYFRYLEFTEWSSASQCQSICTSVCLSLYLHRDTHARTLPHVEGMLTSTVLPFLLVSLAPGLSSSGDSLLPSPSATVSVILLPLHLQNMTRTPHPLDVQHHRLKSMALLYTKRTLVLEATAVRQTFSSFGGRPRFRGLCSWALLRHLEPLSAEPEVTLFFPSPTFFFTFPSDRLSLRFSSPEFGLLLSSLELRRFLSSAEVWDDV